MGTRVRSTVDMLGDFFNEFLVICWQKRAELSTASLFFEGLRNAIISMIRRMSGNFKGSPPLAMVPK
jgi:hypothetical protein